MIWSYRACAAKDGALMDSAVNQLFTSVVFSSQKGLQCGYSCFQHGKQLYLADYGEVFLTGEYKAVAAVMGTKSAPFRLEPKGQKAGRRKYFWIVFIRWFKQIPAYWCQIFQYYGPLGVG